mmetsp:Transcript_46314/g.79875  ORF Transcript_46314/g.79875 Transcript_46314/m.79875 type:complete len:358 (-) Transcript_46314:220-1293(-)
MALRSGPNSGKSMEGTAKYRGDDEESGGKLVQGLSDDSSEDKLISGEGMEAAEQEKKSKSSAAFLSCLAYSFCSCSMVLSNKALASNFGADIDVLMVLFQNLVAIVLVETLRRRQYIETYAYNNTTALKWLPVNLFFVMMLFTGFMSLKSNNVPMVTVFKNLTNIIIVGGDWYFHGEQVTFLIVASFAVMLIGAILAAYADVEFNAIGYFWMAANCCCTAGYVLYMRFATQSIKLSRWAMVYYNNLLSVPSMLIMATLKGELGIFFNSPDLWTLPFFFTNLYTGVVGFGLNLASLWCVGANSATTYAIVGSLNKIPVSVLGFLFFDVTITAQSAIYITMSMLGGFLYSYAKHTAPKK